MERGGELQGDAGEWGRGGIADGETSARGEVRGRGCQMEVDVPGRETESGALGIGDGIDGLLRGALCGGLRCGFGLLFAAL